jgi:hypothetical protein
MATVTKTAGAGEFIVSKANGTRSIDTVTVLSGQVLEAGTVIGKVTASGKYKAYDNDAADGTQTATGIVVDSVDATGGDTLAAVLVRDAEVDQSKLKWGAAVTTQGEKDAAYVDLAALGIIFR